MPFVFGKIAQAQSPNSQPLPPVIVALFPNTQLSNDFTKQFRLLKNKLRDNPRLEVLTYDPDAPAFLLAAQSAHVDPDDISAPATRSALSSALEAKLSVTISQHLSSKNRLDAIICGVKLPKGLTLSEIDLDNSSVDDIVQKVSDQIALFDSTPSSQPSIPAPLVAPIAPTVSQAPVQTTITPKPFIETPVAAPPPSPIQVQPAPITAPPVAASPKPEVDAVPAPTIQKQVQVAPPPAPIATVPTVSAAPEIQQAPTTPTVQPPAQVAPTPIINESVPAPARPIITPQTSPVTVSEPPPTKPIEVTMPHHSVEVQSDLPDVGASQSAPETPIDDDTRKLLGFGDDAIAHSDYTHAIEMYRQAVDASPRNMQVRIKLAGAYISAGMSDRAADELKRASEIDPTSDELSAYLQKVLDSGVLPAASDIQLTMKAAATPNDPESLIALGDSYWNSSRLVDAESSYNKAIQLAPDRPEGYARLARLYAATERYDECIGALDHSGSLGYSSALRIIDQRVGILTGNIDTALESFKTGEVTRTQFYDSLTSMDQSISSYTQFILRITPPAAYKVSYLHRKLAANLLVQVTPALQNYSLTLDQQFLDQATSLEKSAMQEQSIADVADKLQQQVLVSN